MSGFFLEERRTRKIHPRDRNHVIQNARKSLQSRVTIAPQQCVHSLEGVAEVCKMPHSRQESIGIFFVF